MPAPRTYHFDCTVAIEFSMRHKYMQLMQINASEAIRRYSPFSLQYKDSGYLGGMGQAIFNGRLKRALY